MKILTLILLVIATYSNAQDVARCKDAEPAYLNRMPGFYISECKNSEYNDVEFIYYVKGSAQKINKGGKYYNLFYSKMESEAQKVSSAQINQNYSNAILKVKGTALDDKKTTFAASVNGKEVYIKVHTAANSTDSKSYRIEVVEVETMKQDVVVNMDEAINQYGKIAIYGILFDVGKSDIKPESAQSLKQITDYLNANPSVKIFIVGHTDNTGTLVSNTALSKSRAESIKNYLVSSAKIDEQRLSTAGVASLCPVSTNDTEEGRRLNRRVEIVKQ
ncbi:MAG: OmpA family protein [Cyclobacteriaceae bacterium]|nr:OmpA family protein [Cyclobacteriaceae bacterium]